MKHYKTPKKIRDYARNYYREHKDKLYKPRKNKVCKICGTSLKHFPHGHFSYCSACINDKNKTTRQARWYRRNALRLQVLRRKNKQKKEEMG